MFSLLNRIYAESILVQEALTHSGEKVQVRDILMRIRRVEG